MPNIATSSRNPDFTKKSANMEMDTFHDNSSEQGAYGPILGVPDRKTLPRNRLIGWLDGPEVLVDPNIRPVLPAFQTFPNKIIRRLGSRKFKLCLGMFLVCWAGLFYSLAARSILAVPMINGEPVKLLTCGVDSDLWKGKNEKCGIDGEKCRASHQGDSFAFKCPSNCQRQSWTYSGTPVGDIEAIYRPFVIGGVNNSYRADSFPCAAAVHAGEVSNRIGGCARVKFNGAKLGFPGSEKNGIASIDYDGEFPASYGFDSTDNMVMIGCYDLGDLIVVVNLLLSHIFGYFVADPGVFFWVQFLAGFWTVILASHPPKEGGSSEANAELISLAFRRLLPALLSSFAIYRVCVVESLDKGYLVNLSRALLWVPAFWAGILENYVFAYLPIDRLTVDDLSRSSGAWTALAIILIIVVGIVALQGLVIWRAGKLRFYALLYAAILILLWMLSLIPNETLRIHHYILALILLPGTAFKTSCSLVYQGFLIGLFISGIARWDFDSILQTFDQLRRGAPSNKGAVPSIEAIKVGSASDSGSNLLLSNITLVWDAIVSGSEGILDEWDGVSLVINDVERYRGPQVQFPLSNWMANWTDIPERVFVRLAYAQILGSSTGDYSSTRVLDARGWAE